MPQKPRRSRSVYDPSLELNADGSGTLNKANNSRVSKLASAYGGQEYRSSSSYNQSIDDILGDEDQDEIYHDDDDIVYNEDNIHIVHNNDKNNVAFGVFNNNNNANKKTSFAQQQQRKRRQQIACVVVPIAVLVALVFVFVVSDKSNGKNGNTVTFPSQYLPQPPSMLSQVCSPAAVAQNRKPCQEVCEVADCCYIPVELQLSCMDNADTCGQYQKHCDNLRQSSSEGDSADVTTTSSTVSSNSNIVDPPPFLNFACDTTSVQFDVGHEYCKYLCEFGSCCFDDTCKDDPQCSTYMESCGIIYNKSDDAQINVTSIIYTDKLLAKTNPEPAPANFVELCHTTFAQETASTQPGFAFCHNTCEAASCCWKDKTCDNDSVCDVYVQVCGGLTEEPPEAPEEIDLICSISALKFDVGLKYCQSVCDKAPCCWNNKDENISSCHSQHAEICLDYVNACTTLLDDEVTNNDEMAFTLNEFINPPPAPLVFEDICVADATRTLKTAEGVAFCHDICEATACCWKGDAICRENNSQVCTVYERVCADANGVAVFTSDLSISQTETTVGASIAPAPPSLPYVCDADSLQLLSGTEFCFDICDDASCCWSSDTDSCLDENADVCAGYAPCKILDETFLASQIDNNCKMVMSDAQYATCHDYCAYAPCCWDDNYKSNNVKCNDEDLWNDNYCMLFELCVNLSVDTVTAAAAASNQDDKTDLSSQAKANREKACASDDTVHECIAMCSAGLCCHSKVEGESCANTAPEINCDDYASCDVLF